MCNIHILPALPMQAPLLGFIGRIGGRRAFGVAGYSLGASQIRLLALSSTGVNVSTIPVGPTQQARRGPLGIRNQSPPVMDLILQHFLRGQRAVGRQSDVSTRGDRPPGDDNRPIQSPRPPFPLRRRRGLGTMVPRPVSATGSATGPAPRGSA
jgi:hypothetical protein